MSAPHSVGFHDLQPLKTEDDHILVKCNNCDWEEGAPNSNVAELYARRHVTISQTY